MPQEINLDDTRARLAFMRVFKGLSEVPLTYRDLRKNELHETRKKLYTSMKEVLDRLETEKRDFNESENLAYQYAETLYSQLDADIEIRTKMEYVTGKIDADPREIVNPLHRGDYTPSIGERLTRSREYRSLFFPNNPGVQLDSGGFQSMAEFFQAVASQQRDSRLRELKVETRTNVAGSGVGGGFAAPEAFTQILMDRALLAGEIFRPRALVLPMQGGSVPAPMFDADDRTGGSLFGLQLEFYGENKNMDIQTVKLKLMTLTAKKGAILWEESRELIQDAPAFNQKLSTLLPRVIAAGLDRVFYKGNGVGKPMGAINAPSTITLNRTSVGDIVYADIKAMWGKLHPTCHQNAVWIVNSASIPKLLGLKDDNNGSIWHPGLMGSVKDGIPQTLFGKEVLYCESAPAIGSPGDIALCDPSQYCIGIRQDMAVESSNAPGFTRDVTTFRITLRIDGAPMLSKPIKMEDGSELSWASILS